MCVCAIAWWLKETFVALCKSHIDIGIGARTYNVGLYVDPG